MGESDGLNELGELDEFDQPFIFQQVVAILQYSHSLVVSFSFPLFLLLAFHCVSALVGYAGKGFFVLWALELC